MSYNYGELAKQIAIQDKKMDEALLGGKKEIQKKKQAIEMLKKINSENPNILLQIENMQKNLDNDSKTIHSQYEALYKTLEYLNGINKVESSNKIMKKIKELENDEKDLKSII